jgi:hypothetical protein
MRKIFHCLRICIVIYCTLIRQPVKRCDLKCVFSCTVITTQNIIRKKLENKLYRTMPGLSERTRSGHCLDPEN